MDGFTYFVGVALRPKNHLRDQNRILKDLNLEKKKEEVIHAELQTRSRQIVYCF
jgi:hypothetical protein